MHRRLGHRVTGIIVVLLCIVGALSLVGTGLTGSAEAVEDELNITAEVDEEAIWVDDTVDFTVNVGNTVNETYQLDNVTVVDGDGEVMAERNLHNVWLEWNEVAEITLDDIGIEERGVTELRALVGVDDHIAQPAGTIEASTDVTARNPDPVIDLGAERALNGTERTLSLTVGNPHNQSINRIDASLVEPDDANLTLVDSSGTLTTVEPSETREIEFTVRGASAGVQEFDLSLGFETADGEYWERTYPASAEFLEPTGSAQIDVAEVSVSPTPNGVHLNGSLFTTSNISVENVQVEPADAPGIEPARPNPQSYISGIDGQGTGSFGLTAALEEDRESIPLQVQYQTDGTERETTVEIPYTGPRSVAPVQLTDVSVSGGATVTITGEVANTRESEVTGVTVQVADKEDVSPGTPGEFFAGSIDAGTFTPMEPISGEVTGDRDTIPVEITYVFEGIQYTSVVDVDHEGGGPAPDAGGQQEEDASVPEFDPGTDGDDDDDGSLVGGVLPLVAGGLVVVALGIGAVIYRRR